MSKIDLVPVTGAQNVSAINDNFEKIAEALNDKVLYRDNPRNEPNQMDNDQDMNGKRIYNLPEPVFDHEPVRKKEMGDVKKSLRVSDRELPPLPGVAARRNKIVSFDNNGNPEVRFPSADSATKLRQDLTTFNDTISADAEWSDVPAHIDPVFDVQTQALADRTELLHNHDEAQFQALSDLKNETEVNESRLNEVSRSTAIYSARTAKPKIYGINPIVNRMSQPVIAGWDFRRVPTGVISSPLGSAVTTPLVPSASLNQLNGTNSVGVVKSNPIGVVKLPDSGDHRFNHLVVPAGAMGIVANDTAYALEFTVNTAADSVTALHEFILDLGYEQTLEGSAFNDFIIRMKLSTDNGATWTQYGSDFSFGISSAVTKYCVAGSGGIHYWRYGVTFPITPNNVDQKVFVTGAQTIKVRLYFSYAADSVTSSIQRRVLVSNVRLEGVSSLLKTSLANNGVVYSQAGEFCAWPAGCGHMQWGNRIVVGFEAGVWEDKPGDHDIDYSTLYQRFAASDDGGQTWSSYTLPNVVPPDQVTATIPRVNLDMSTPGFGFIFRQQYKWWTFDYGQTFIGPSIISGASDWNWYARTSYHIMNKNQALLFMTAGRKNPNPSQSTRYIPSVWQSNTGGNTWNPITTIGPEDFWNDIPAGFNGQREMPRAIKMADGHFVLAIRERRSSHQWISIWETRDNWKTVNQLSRIAFDADNPPAFVKVGTDLYVIYCSRVSGPTGLVFVRSSDGGVSWSLPVYLRTDAYSWDVGYPVAFVREDGKILTCYYYHTADNQYQHIASTVFDPAAVGDLPLMPEYAPMYQEAETI